MKKRTRMLAMFLCFLALCSCLEGCKASIDQKQKTDGTDGAADNSEEDFAGTDEWSWPLPEKKELSIWIEWNNDYAEDPNELFSMEVHEENTNVHINWTALGSSEVKEKFGLMLASGEYPDIIRHGDNWYSGGVIAMEQDGVTVDLTDLIPTYMPNYQTLRTSDPDVERATKGDDGRLLAVYSLASDNGVLKGEHIWHGLVLRKDWLEELEMESPVTIEDWHKVLVAFKEHYGCEAPLMIGQNGTDASSAFTSAYGVLSALFLDGDTVKFGPVEEGYRQWIELFRDWYAEGLIDPNFTANGAGYMAPAEYIATGRAGAGVTIYSVTADTYKNNGYTDEEGFWLAAVPLPVLNEGDTPMTSFRTSEIVKESLTVTSNCKDVELALRYLDYHFTKESMLLNSYGIENDSYFVDTEGNYQISDKIKDQVAKGEYPTVNEAVGMYNLFYSAFGLYNWGASNVTNYDSATIASRDVWNVARFDRALPAGITLTPEENTSIGTIYTDINTLVQENTIQYITGQKSLDDWDLYVETIHSYGLDKVLAVYQSAYDRYLAR